MCTQTPINSLCMNQMKILWWPYLQKEACATNTHSPHFEEYNVLTTESDPEYT